MKILVEWSEFQMQYSLDFPRHEIMDYILDNITKTEMSSSYSFRCWVASTEEGVPHPVKVDVPLVDPTICTASLSSLLNDEDFKISIFEVCAGGESGKSACEITEAGAPLVCQGTSGKWYLEGIAAWSLDINCQKDGPPMVFTRVARFTNFVASIEPPNTCCEFFRNSLKHEEGEKNRFSLEKRPIRSFCFYLNQYSR